jgi:prephenate dehydratase
MGERAGQAMTKPKIAFQGEPGGYSHLASREAQPDLEPLPCGTFEDVFATVFEGRADLGMIPIENSLHGRVSDIHHLLPESGLHIVGEHFGRIHRQLMAVKGATLSSLKSVVSAVPALGQCRQLIREMKLKETSVADTASAARQVAEMKDAAVAAIASELAADIHGLEILKRDVEDAPFNVTRFLLMAREPREAAAGKDPVMTTFVFRVRNVPAALYKAMGGFATSGINMTKLESYQLEGAFTATQFYADIEGHPSERRVRLALEELQFFSTHLRILGVYKAHPYRTKATG